MRLRILAVLSTLLLLAAGCGGDSGDSGDSAGGSGGGLSLRIVEPAGDAPVCPPFMVKVEASVPLGTTESGKHHIHVWFDDNENDYQVVEADQVEIASGDLSPGEHVIHASLRHANHSAAGAEAEQAVMVTGGGAPAPAPASPSQTDGPYGY
jgi:hypothetical protein